MSRDFVKHARTLSLLTMLSRVLGMLRETALAAAFGTQDIMGAFNIAFNLPNLFRRLFGEGALSAAFIPVFTGLIEQKDEKAAQRLANLVVTLLVVTLAAITLIGEFIIWTLWHSPAPTLRFSLALSLSAIMLPFVLTICLVGFLQAILNVRGHFAVPAFAPIILNLCIIAAAVLIGPRIVSTETGLIHVVAVAVLVAGLIQVAILLPVLYRHGFRFRLAWDLASPQLRRVVGLMLPMLVGLGIVQFNTFVDMLIAMGFSSPQAALADDKVIPTFTILGHVFEYPMRQGAISVLNYSQRLYELPVGVFTIALGTAIFPALARAAHHNDHRDLADTLNRGLRLAAFIGVPCAVGIFVVATPLVRLILNYGQFAADPLNTVRVASVTRIYVLGLVVFAALHLITRAFFALQETRTPVKSSAVAAGANFLLNISLVWTLYAVTTRWPALEMPLPPVAGLAMATVITAAGQVAYLALALRRRIGRLGLRAFLRSLVRTLIASALMAPAAWGAMAAAQLLLDRQGINPASKLYAGAGLAAAVVAGAVVFFVAARLMKMTELSEVLSRRTRRRSDDGAPPSDAPPAADV